MKKLICLLLLAMSTLAQAKVTAVETLVPTVPVMINRQYNPVLGITVKTDHADKLSFVFEIKGVKPAMLDEIALYAKGKDFKPEETPGDHMIAIKGKRAPANGKITLTLKKALPAGDHRFFLSLEPNKKLSIDSKVSITLEGVKAKPAAPLVAPTGGAEVTQRIGYAIAVPNQKVSNGRVSKYFRIPGLARTKQGTLIAVFDNRYGHNGDLPADIDVAIRRSTDGGQTWSPIQVAIDKKDIPGIGHGVGDPAILVDNKTGWIWVAGLASPKSGHPIFKSSKGTAAPAKCGQWILAYSKNDGKSWSKPINITESIKRLADPDTKSWGCIFQGPGNGICLKDGTLVFPAQVWGNMGGAPHHGLLVYSKDNGKTWQSSKAMTFGGSESQVAQLSNGSLMLSTREGNGGNRSVGVTKDLGQTWTKHASMSKADGRLRSPFCQACLISATVKGKHMLYFSNPNAGSRREMTIKQSKNDGMTWSKGLLYDERNGMGYSAIIPVDDEKLGIFYESQHGYLQFMRVPFSEIK